MPEEGKIENIKSENGAVAAPKIVEGKNILIVEDDKFLRSLIEERLKKANANVISALDGEEGLEKAKEIKPDIVLLDILLPGIDGFEVLKQMKESSELADIPVVIISNLGTKEDIRRGKELGAVEFLVKARLNLDEILQRLSIIFEESAKKE